MNCLFCKNIIKESNIVRISGVARCPKCHTLHGISIIGVHFRIDSYLVGYYYDNSFYEFQFNLDFGEISTFGLWVTTMDKDKSLIWSGFDLNPSLTPENIEWWVKRIHNMKAFL